MDRRPAPTNARSLNTRLDNLCAARGIPPGRGRRLVGVVVAGQLLAETEAGVVKGASNIEVRVGTDRSRVSSDLDTVRRETLDEYRGDLERALRAGWHGFTGILKDRGPIETPAPVSYQPHRFRLKLEYRAGDFTSLTLEVSPEEASSLAERETVPAHDAVEWFAALGLPEPAPLPVLPLPHQVAQKLHACTAPDTDEWTNDRSHDLVDLQLAMAGDATTDFGPFRAAAERLFASRRVHGWPPTVSARAGWELTYPQQAAGLGVHPSWPTRSPGRTSSSTASPPPDVPARCRGGRTARARPAAGCHPRTTVRAGGDERHGHDRRDDAHGRRGRSAALRRRA